MRKVYATIAAFFVGLIAIVGVVIGLSACGYTVTPSKTSATTPFICYPKEPAQAGECIKQELLFKGVKLGAPPKASSNPQGLDISNWQGAINLRAYGARFVIIQTNDGFFRNPFFWIQRASAEADGIPWGTYTFVESANGAQQANIANSMGRGPLGAWADTEVPGSYQRACEYVNQARANGNRIVGVYASPGNYSGGRCQGYIWPSEWGGGRAYPLNGYPSSAIKVRQWSGTTIDRDESLGLLSLVKPPTPPHPKPTRRAKEAELRAINARILVLRNLETKRKCRVVHGSKAYKACRVWGPEGRREHKRAKVVETEIRSLH